MYICVIILQVLALIAVTQNDWRESTILLLIVVVLIHIERLVENNGEK